MKIELENLKGISRLEFDIPRAGLWLLTGLNGSGKTSLLAALYRIGNGRAFQNCYKTTATQNKLDTFKDTAITYRINNDVVTYSYGGSRWRPKPSKNSQILSNFPYPNIQFVEANGSRVEPYPDEIAPRYIRAANADIQSFISFVLQDNKWNDLKFVNTRRGRGSDAYLIPYNSGREIHYYSEKNFSLGELCVLKLAKKVMQSEDGSMILIDEIEMALHPQAQIRLLTKIQELADEKNLTIIFSTHSSTLVKNIDRKKIIFLSDDDQGNLVAKTGVFPAQVLGELAYDEELNCDHIFFVEDEQAKLLLEQLCGIYEQNAQSHKAAYKIVSVGGYPQVMSMLDTASQIFPRHIKRHAFLDDDVRLIGLPQAGKRVTDLYNRVQNNVAFLPCTPELGVIEMFEEYYEKQIINRLRINLSGAIVRIDPHLMSADYIDINGDNPRDVAKKKLNSIVDYIAASCGVDGVSIRRQIYRLYCDDLYSEGVGPLMALLGPVFNAR